MMRPAIATATLCCGLGLVVAFQPSPLQVPPSRSLLARTPLATPSIISRPHGSIKPSLLPLRPSPVVVRRRVRSSSSSSSSGVEDSSTRRRGGDGGRAREQRMARLLLGAAAVVLVAGGAARAFPGLLVQGDGGLLATIAPIARMQDSMSRGPLGKQGPLAPVGALVGWALDVVEVVLEGVGGVVSVFVWPLRLLLRALVLPLLGSLAVLVQDPQGVVGQLALAVAGALTWVGEAAGAYAQGLAALVAATLGLVGRYLGNVVGALFNAPALQYLDAMDPARHIPEAAPAVAYRAAQGIKLTSSFGLKQMYGRRWTVHAGKWDWCIPFWERCVMESQLARYRANWPKAAVKARFGFPEILRGPSPLLGGTLLVLTGIYLLYKGHVTSAIWIRQLQSETYGKQTWNPVTRLEEEEGEGGSGEGGGGAQGGEEEKA